MSALTITKFTNAYEQNSYLISNDKESILIDAGVSIEEIKKVSPLPIVAVFITHFHFDHVVQINDYKGVKIYAHPRSKEIMSDAEKNASTQFNTVKTFSLDFIPVANGQQIDVLNSKITVMFSPGHTFDGVCYLIDNNLFSGDTLFKKAIGRYDLSTSNKQELTKSLQNILNMDYVNLYPGHGEASTNIEQQNLIPKWLRYLKIY